MTTKYLVTTFSADFPRNWQKKIFASTNNFGLENLRSMEFSKW